MIGAKEQQRRLPDRRLLVLVAAAAVLLLLALMIWRGLALRAHLQRGAHELQAAETLLSSTTNGGQAFRISSAELARADGHLIVAQSEIHAARGDLQSLAIPVALARRLPFIGGRAAALPAIVDFAGAATLGARQLVAGLQPLAHERESATSSLPAAARFSQALSAGSTNFQAAQIDLQQAQQDRLAIHRGAVLPVLRGSLAPLTQWDREWPTVQADVSLLVQLPPVLQATLGFGSPQTFAILGQNSAELRPTGGFLGTMGIVQVSNGKIIKQDYRSIYTYDPDTAGTSRPLPSAPAPLTQHLGIAGWHIQDANWSPDFPTSANDLRAFLRYDTGITVNGVIAFDSYAVQELLRTLGPVSVTINGTTQTFSADNWLALTTQLIFLDPEHPNAVEGKGRVLSPLLREVLARANAASGDQLTNLVETLRTAIAERHILFQFDNPTAEQFVYRYGASGSLQLAPNTLTLYPVESNLSYTKVGPFIKQQSVYELWFDANGACQRARVALTWQNMVTQAQINDPVNRIAGDQWDAATGRLIPSPGVYGFYERLYTPPGTALTASQGTQEAVAQTTDGSFTVFGTYLSVLPGQSHTLDFSLALANREASPGHLLLDIPKQPGTQDRTVEVIIHTSGERVPSANLALTPDGNGTYHVAEVLNRSLHLDLTLK